VLEVQKNNKKKKGDRNQRLPKKVSKMGKVTHGKKTKKEPFGRGEKGPKQKLCWWGGRHSEKVIEFKDEETAKEKKGLWGSKTTSKLRKFIELTVNIERSLGKGKRTWRVEHFEKRTAKIVLGKLQVEE